MEQKFTFFKAFRAWLICLGLTTIFIAIFVNAREYPNQYFIGWLKSYIGENSGYAMFIIVIGALLFVTSIYSFVGIFTSYDMVKLRIKDKLRKKKELQERERTERLLKNPRIIIFPKRPAA